MNIKITTIKIISKIMKDQLTLVPSRRLFKNLQKQKIAHINEKKITNHLTGSLTLLIKFVIL